MFWRGVLGYLPVQVVQGLVGFGSVYVFTRLLTAEQYGQYALALSAAALLHAGFITWMEASMERFHIGEAQRGEAPSHLTTLHRAFLLLGFSSLVVTAVALGVLPLDPALENAIAGAVVASTLRSGLRLVQQRRKAEGQVAVYALNDILVTAGGFALGVAMTHAGFGALAPFLGTAGAAGLFLLLAIPREWRRSAGGRFEPARARRYAAYGLPISLTLLLAVIYSSTDRFMIALFLDERSVGAYHAAFGLADRTLDLLFIWIGLAGWPAAIAALERDGIPAMRKVATDQFELLALVALPAAVGLAAVAGPLSEVMIGEALRGPAAAIIPWITLCALFAGFKAYYFDQAFTLARRPAIMLIPVGLAAVMNIILNILLIPRFGLEGAVVATTLSVGSAAAASCALGRRVMPLPVPWGTLLRCAACAGAMGVAVRSGPDLGGAPELAVKIAIGVAVYALAALLVDAAHVRSRALTLLPSRRRAARLASPPSEAA